MPIPFDFEDIVGVGCWDSIRRGIAAVTCVWIGTATGIAGINSADLVEILATGGTLSDWEVATWAYLLGPLLLVFSLCLPLALPLLLACYFCFVRSEEGGGVKGWIGFAAAWGLLIVLRDLEWDGLSRWSALAIFFWLGWIGTIAFAAWMLAAWQRRKFTEHLMELEAANEVRRQEMRDEFGTAHADPEWTIGKTHTWQDDPEE